MSKDSKTVMMDIAKIRISIYVREKLDDDRVLLFAQLYENGEKIPPIEVTKDGRLKDGRHRLAAQQLLDRKEVACQIVPNKNNIELIFDAFKANFGGPKPPTQGDIEHTIQLLLKEGAPQTQIVSSLPFPASLCRKYLKTVKDAMAAAQLRKAINEVAEGEMSVNQAAVKYNVDPAKLKTKISGTKKKLKSNVGEMTSNMTRLTKSHSLKIAKILMRVQESVTHGEMLPSHAKTVLEKAIALNQQTSKSLSDWTARIEQAIKTSKK